MPLDAFNSWADKARAVPIEAEIERRGIKLRGGVDRCGPCPKCGGVDRFSINVAKQLFNCRGCEVGGDVIKMVEHLDGVDFEHACQTLTGMPKPNGRRYYPKIKQTTATFEYRDEGGAVVYVIDRIEFQAGNGVFVLKGGKREKTFRQRRPDPGRPGEWIHNVDSISKIPYRLPELIEGVASQQLIFIVEGEGKVDALRQIGIVATCNPGGAGKWLPEFSQHLRGADVVLLPDNDEPGWKHINEIGASLAGIAGRVRVLVLPDLPAKGDIRDWLAAGGTREQLDALVETALDWQPPQEAPPDKGKDKATADEQAMIDELARLDAIDYDRRRNEAADQMGIRRGTLDDRVNARRAEQAEEEGPPPLFGHWVVEPWPEAVGTGDLILALAGRVRRHVILSDDEALTIAKGRKLPDTTLTRSIIIEMKRKKAGETVTHFRSIDDAGLAELRRRALRWADDNGEKLDRAEPEMPPGFDNRLGDNWSLLLAIADYAGDEWSTKARKAAVALSKVDGVTSIGVQALAAIKVVFDGPPDADGCREPLERVSSADLAADLGADMAGPFSEWKNGKPITQAQLARVLKPFRIAPETIRLQGGGTPRGYMRSQFEDAWERYL